MWRHVEHSRLQASQSWYKGSDPMPSNRNTARSGNSRPMANVLVRAITQALNSSARGQPRGRASNNGRKRKTKRTSDQRQTVRSRNTARQASLSSFSNTLFNMGMSKMSSNPAPINVGVPRIRSIGMADVHDHEMAYTPCNLIVGNGTIGIAGYIYPYYVNSGTQLLQYGCVPVAPADSQIGDSYMSDVFKHYSRKVINKFWVELIPIQTSTTNSGLVVLAPTRGGGDTYICANTQSGSAQNLLPSTAVSMSDHKECAVWDGGVYDFTNYIAGGTGVRQNEFSVFNTDTGSASVVSQNVDGVGIIPSVVYFGGLCTTSLNAQQTHIVVYRMKVSLLDYRGNNSIISPTLKTDTLENLLEKSRKLNEQIIIARLKDRTSKSSKDELNVPSTPKSEEDIIDVSQISL